MAFPARAPKDLPLDAEADSCADLDLVLDHFLALLPDWLPLAPMVHFLGAAW